MALECWWCGQEGEEYEGLFANVHAQGNGHATRYDVPILCTECRSLLAIPPRDESGEPRPDLVQIEFDEALGEVADDLATIWHSGDHPRNSCWWCDRPGTLVETEYSTTGYVWFRNPILCDLCAALLGYQSGTQQERQAAYEKARAAVLKELEDRYRASARHPE